ncbi:hypothetical protein ABB37_05959 [Leptomonas pyrrhocoris]|uniref:Uncharacterized protein n=1 Tax=Leptomonas pyrrhocoris TaxID=157538 RepID=A0A0M9FYU9_LEPPY|nr:hypothetical protein ABB37_05959 [Leptomonas pyrrhocoris]KPA78895.1 hypothetical protein ABB37_05959 [Leptomonas pyrrhocoris]|eukprot:XP_015657334.1 hypothetical protein ABB37_05959 [Leptomonas pyrrhocoris]
MKSPISPSTEGATCGEPPAKSGVDPSREDAQRRTAESRKTLQEEFHSEVASFQHQLRRRGKVAASKIPDSPSNNEPACTAYAGFTSSSFNERAAAHTTYANVSQLPLVTVLTSTHSSLASALRATAVAWAVGGSEHWTSAGATHVLWRPAPETALAAAWMVVLLRRHAHEQETRRRLNADAGTADDVTPLAAAKTERATAAGAADATPAGPHIEVQETEKESSTLSSVSSSPGFHVLLTGGDTEVNFVAPYLEGVAHASRLHEVTSRVSHVVAFHGAGSKEGRRTGAPFLGGDNGVESPVLLCYGCPAAQVRDLRCFLARQHKRQPSEPETSNIVAELRTEVATTGIVMSDAIAELSAAAPIGQQTVAAEKKDALDRAPSTAPFTTAQTSCVDPATCAQGGSQKRPTSAAGRSPSWEAPFRAVPSRDTTLRTISSVFEPVPSCESACAAVMVPRGGLTEVANEVFRRSVVEPPFLRSSRDTSPSLFAAANTSTATTANRTNEGKQSALFESVSLPSPSTIPGWCSLCFVAEQHTAPLLRSLVQRHWKEPWYIGHSLDGSSRRGPAPSSAHTQGIQDVLRCATNGTDVCEGATLCLKHRIADDDAAAPPHFRQAICWRHGCGGFSLPLTATAGRGSSYTLPCLLVTDLEAAMTEGEQHDLLLYRASGLTDGRTRRGNGAASPPDHSAATSSLSLSASPLNAVGAAPLRSRQEGDDTHDLDTRVKRAAQRATRAIQRNVAGLVEMYDARQLGYRGVVAGNFLFLCRYPAAVEDAVVAAVLEGVTAR